MVDVFGTPSEFGQLIVYAGMVGTNTKTSRLRVGIIVGWSIGPKGRQVRIKGPRTSIRRYSREYAAFRVIEPAEYKTYGITRYYEGF